MRYNKNAIAVCRKFTPGGGKMLMPLSVTCRHSDANGWQLVKFFEKLQAEANEFKKIYLSIDLSTGILPPVLNSYLLQHFKRKSAVFPCFFSTKQLPANPV